MMPAAIANFVNTLRADVDGCESQLQSLIQEAARLRVADDRTVHDCLDALKSLITARFFELVKSGQLRKIADSTPAEPQDQGAKASGVKFPTLGT